MLLILLFLQLDTLSPTPIPVLPFSVLFSWSYRHPDVPHEYLSVPIQYSISLMMKPDRKLWKQSVWNYNIIVIRNVLNRSNRSKAGKKITPVNSKHSQEFFLAPFWHRWSYFSILNLSLLSLIDKFPLISALKIHRWFYFPPNRKTPETLRFRGILRLDTCTLRYSIYII